MYLTPVVYPEEILPSTIRFWIVLLNPMYSMVKLFRMPLYYGRFPTLEELVPSVVIVLVVLIGGWWFFSLRADEFAYRA
jgi:ABC-type polysaccharide/polyol phosphate export permease